LKRLFQTLSLVVLLSLPALPCSAADTYFGVNAGAWTPHDTSTIDSNLKPITSEYSTGWSLGGTYGTSFANGFRVENELVYRQAEAKRCSSDAWNLAFLFNAWWDGRNSTPVAPYFGGGFGFASGRNASPGIVDNRGSGIAYQAGGGFILSPRSSGYDIDLGYRYFGINDTSNRTGAMDVTGSSWLLGIKKIF